MDIMSDPTTLKKAWEEGRVAKIIKNAPATKEVFVELGLVSVVPGSRSSEDESVRSVCTCSRSIHKSVLTDHLPIL